MADQPPDPSPTQPFQAQATDTNTDKASSSPHNKPCTLCHVPRPILVRCQIDNTGKWHFVCPGKCWHSVSGGVEDARGLKDQYPYYRYGGMWKNRHEDGPVSARKPKKVKERQRRGRKGKEDEKEAGDGAGDTDAAGGNTDEVSDLDGEADGV